MAAGVTSDATNIYIYDDAHADAGGDGAYSFADIYAKVTATEMTRVDSGTGVPTYRFLKNLQIGDTTTGTLTTTLSDTNVVCTFDAGKVLKTRATQATSWKCLLGTKVGTGNLATGKNGCGLYFHNAAGTNTVIVRGTVKLYGCTLKSTTTGGVQALQFPIQTAGASELVDCILGGFTTFVLGSSGNGISNMYNVDIARDSATSNITSFFVDTASRLTCGGDPAGSYISSNTAGVSFKDIAFFGTPGQSDLAPAPAATNWVIIRPTWSGNADKFSGTAPASASTGAHEYWLWNVKVVDASGAGISGIPVTLTDTTGAAQVDTTTDANGRVAFGSGLSANAVIVMDHYSVSSVYTQRHRSPFFVEVNTGANANSNYLARRYYYYWPGYESITTTAGAFEDVADIIAIQDQPGAPTTWTEMVAP